VLSDNSDMSVVRRVGSKGELFIPKEIREKLRLKPCMKVIFKFKSGRTYT